jgi:signal transduction histidine kinase
MSSSGAASARVLVVDDDAALAENLAEILQTAGHSVRTVGSCAEANAAAKDRVDVALVDLKLPDGEGTSLVASLREVNPECEVILLTGFGTLQSAAAAVRAGACAYLLKPCVSTELLLAVEQALRQVSLQRKKTELTKRAQIAEKLAAVGTLTAGLSHEIRNPLNAAALQLSVLERKVHRLPEHLRASLIEPLSLASGEIRRLEQILQDFLQFARPVHFVPRPVDLSALLKNVCNLLVGDAERRGIKLEYGGNAVPPVSGDDARLRQVIMHLTLNALDAAGHGGLVQLSSTEEEGGVSMTVEDTGPGIPEKDMSRIFEPFFTTKPAGSGLGLPIVHAIVTQHGGTVAVENVPGAGARFTVWLPKVLEVAVST